MKDIRDKVAEAKSQYYKGVFGEEEPMLYLGQVEKTQIIDFIEESYPDVKLKTINRTVVTGKYNMPFTETDLKTFMGMSVYFVEKLEHCRVA